MSNYFLTLLYFDDEEFPRIFDNHEIGKIAVIIAIGILVFKVEVGFLDIHQATGKQKHFYILNGYFQCVQNLLEEIQFGITVEVVRRIMKTNIVFVVHVFLIAEQTELAFLDAQPVNI